MRKNKSSKQNSVCRGNGSKGKEISIDLDAKYKLRPQQSRYQNQSDHHNITDRLNYSSNWQQNPMISQNILKEIINYSNLSQSKGRTTKGNTVAIYDKINEDVYAQLTKINKKSSLGDLGLISKRQKKLTLNSLRDNVQNQMLRSIQLQNNTTPLTKSTIDNRQKPQDLRMSEQLFGHSQEKSYSKKRQIDHNNIIELQAQNQQLAQKMDQVTILQDNICHQFSQMIPDWQRLIVCQKNIDKLQIYLSQNKQSYDCLRKSVEELNLQLLYINKQFVISRRKWNQKGYGAKGRVLEEAQLFHQQFIKKITIKDFEETVLFNMKVAIPDHKGRSTVKAIYEQLFQSHSTKKFTMILKKHSSHMDLYDGKLLVDFTKKINDLQTQYIKAESESIQHPDDDYLDKIHLIIKQIENKRQDIQKKQLFISKFTSQLEQQRQNYKTCEKSIHSLIDEINSQVRGEYVRQTEKEADFKIFLLSKYSGKYKEYKMLHEKRQQLNLQTKQLQKKIENSRQSFL